MDSISTSEEPTLIVAHVEVMADHMGHGGRHQVGLVHV